MSIGISAFGDRDGLVIASSLGESVSSMSVGIEVGYELATDSLVGPTLVASEGR